jgi:hypothetical protein
VIEHAPQPIPPPHRSRLAHRDPDPIPEPPAEQPAEPAATTATEPPDPVEECGLDQDELRMTDFIHDMEHDIVSATTLAEIDEVRGKLDAQRKWIGQDQYEMLLFRQQARRRELTGNVSRK